MEHELKTWMPYYDAVLSGEKPFEVRKNDRGFQKGDVLFLREWNQGPCRYTGRHHKRSVTYVLTGEEFGVRDGFAVLGLGEMLHEQP